MLNQNSSSWCPREHLGYPISIHPHYMRPIDLPGFHGFNTGSKMMLQASDILESHAAQILRDHPSHTLSDHKSHPLCNYAENIPGDHPTGGEVVSPRPQLPLPPSQLPLSLRESRSHGRASRIEDGSLSSHFATARSVTIVCTDPVDGGMTKAENVVYPSTAEIAQTISPLPAASITKHALRKLSAAGVLRSHKWQSNAKTFRGT
ncbi:hypothetical protein EDD17DRAFT_901769 [Pisolithus thermaeus]|nr:hypothetical protein EDD17DRAFT_901769 [Pisolithus thermaeus]